MVGALRLEEHGFFQELKGRSGQMCHPKEKVGVRRTWADSQLPQGLGLYGLTAEVRCCSLWSGHLCFPPWMPSFLYLLTAGLASPSAQSSSLTLLQALSGVPTSTCTPASVSEAISREPM